MCVFFDLESESEIHFRQPEPENLNNPEKTKIFGLSGVSGAGWRKYIYRI